MSVARLHFILLLLLFVSFSFSFSLPQAQAVTLTVAQAFRVAFEFWQAAKEGTHGHPLNDHSVMDERNTHTHIVL